MTIYLKQSTAGQEIPLGHFLDSTDGDTEETGLTIANTDIKLWKFGATALANKNSGGATHISNGIYYAVLDATDTNTLGSLVVFVHVAGALAVKVECVVLAANVYDSLIAGSDLLDVNTSQLGGTSQTGRDIGASVLLSPGTGTGQISLSSGQVTVGTNNDKSGYSLTNLTVQASTTLATGTHNPQTGDSYAYLGTNLGAAGANATEAGGTGDHLNAIPWNAAWDAEVQSECADALGAFGWSGITISAVSGAVGSVTGNVGGSVGSISGVTFPANFGDLAITVTTGRVTVGTNNDKTGYSLTQSFPANFASLAIDGSGYVTYNNTAPLDAAGIRTAVGLATANLDTQFGATITHLTDIKGGTFNGATDSLEAIRDRGDAEWRTATGFSTHSAADVWGVATRTLTAFGFTVNINSNADISAILEDTSELQTDWADGGRLDLLLDAAGSGGDATAANQTTIISHLTGIKGGGWSAGTDTLEEIRDAISGVSVVTTSSPATTSGKVTVIRGDDYAATDSRAIEWASSTWPVLTDATIAVYLYRTAGATADYTFTGSVVTATGTKKVRLELTDTQSASMTTGQYRYEVVATLSSGNIITLVQGHPRSGNGWEVTE